MELFIVAAVVGVVYLFGKAKATSPDKPVKSTLTQQATARLLYENTGWRGDNLVKALEIVIGESGCNPKAINDKLNHDGTIDYGLFQLNSKWFHIHTADEIANALDAVQNVRAAYKSYLKNGWSPWGKGHPSRTKTARAAVVAAGYDVGDYGKA